MKSLLRVTAVLALVALAVPAALPAGTQGRIVGRVIDSSGAPVPDVAITITTPAIKNFKLTTKTGSDGKYGFIVNDATILYKMRFEKDGFSPADINDKKFSTTQITTVDQTLMKGSEAPAARSGAAPAAAAPSANDQSALAYNAGVDLLNSGDKAGAEAKFLEAVGKNADLSQGWQALTSLAYERKDYKKTIEYGQKATDLDPTMTSLWGIMADSASKSGDKAAAAEYRKKFEDANPDTAEMLYNKGIDAYNKKKSKEAEDFLTRAATAKPDFALAHYYLALAAMNNKHNAVAREHFQKYLELEPNGSEAGTAKELLPLVK